MNLAETHDLLAFAAAVDNRRVDDASVAAWQAILPDVDPTDAIEAVRRHFGNSHDYLTPVHVKEGAANIADERRRERIHALDTARAEQQRALAPPVVSTEDRSDEVKALVASVVASLPQMDIHDRARARARRERGRPIPPPPRKQRGKVKPIKYPKPASDDIAALATRYLVDGYQPSAVSALLGISPRWCERAAANLRPAS